MATTPPARPRESPQPPPGPNTSLTNAGLVYARCRRRKDQSCSAIWGDSQRLSDSSAPARPRHVPPPSASRTPTPTPTHIHMQHAFHVCATQRARCHDSRTQSTSSAAWRWLPTSSSCASLRKLCVGRLLTASAW